MVPPKQTTEPNHPTRGRLRRANIGVQGTGCVELPIHVTNPRLRVPGAVAAAGVHLGRQKNGTERWTSMSYPLVN